MMTIRKMEVMIFLVTALALGTPFVSARRDVLQSSGTSVLDSLQNAVTGEPVTLVDIPGLKITVVTEAKVPSLDLSSFLSGKSSTPTISITDKIEGTWLQPVTFNSTTEIPPNIISIIVQKLQGGRGSPSSRSATTLAAADDDVDIDIPDVDVSKSSTTIHSFPIPSLNIPAPKFQFPSGYPSPPPSSPPPPPRRRETSSPPPRHNSSDADSSEDQMKTFETRS